MKSKKVCHGGAHLLGFAVLMVINIRNMKSKKEEHCSPARTLQEFLYMNAFFVSVRIFGLDTISAPALVELMLWLA